MKAASLFIIPVVLMGACLVLAAETDSDVLSFLSWKSSRVEEARLSLERAQMETNPSKPSASHTSISQKAPTLKPTRSDQKVQQAQLNLEIAQELSITDYFVLYLGSMNRESLVEVAKKLTPEEMADLLVAYQKQMSSGSSRELSIPTPSTLSGLTPIGTEKGVKAGM